MAARHARAFGFCRRRGVKEAIHQHPLEVGKGQGQWWRDNHEVHSASVTGPWPNGDRFIVGFQYDITNKPSGTRMKMDDTALFTVKNGKIVREEFFYPT